MRRIVGLVFPGVAAASLAAAADVASSVVDMANAVRSSGCGHRPGVAEALRRVRALDDTADRLARGEALGDSLAHSGYRATRSTSIHIEARSGSGAVAAFLEGRFCAVVTDPALAEIGTASRGDEIWIVLAAPVTLGAADDAATVSARVLELVNLARAEPRRCGRRDFAAATPLAPSAALARAAMTHARDMAARDILTHAGHDGSSVSDRVTRSGYVWRAVAENIAAGQTGADAVVREWLASPGHCSNLMDPRYTDMGVAYAVSATSKVGVYWTQVFARGTD